jgi:hypothetical protein
MNIAKSESTVSPSKCDAEVLHAALLTESIWQCIISVDGIATHDILVARIKDDFDVGRRHQEIPSSD